MSGQLFPPRYYTYYYSKNRERNVKNTELSESGIFSSGSVFLALTVCAQPVEVELMALYCKACFLGHLIFDGFGVQMGHITDFAAFHAADVGMFHHIGIVAEAVFSGVQHLMICSLLKISTDLYTVANSWWGIFLHLVVDHFRCRMFRCMGQHVINSQSLRGHLASVVPEQFGQFSSSKRNQHLHSFILRLALLDNDYYN